MAMSVTPLRVRHRARPPSKTSAPDANALPLRACSTAITELGIDYRAPAALTFADRNARRHPKKQLAQIEASIRRFGFNVPVIIDDHDTVIAGHARVAAARAIGLERIPTIRITHLNAKALQAFRLADNKLAEGAEWDLETLRIELSELSLDPDFSFESIGFDAAEADFIIHGGDETADEANAADAVLPEVRKIAITRLGDVWLLGGHIFICGDALKSDNYERLFGSDRARLIVTDVPYNVPVQGHVSGLGRHMHREFAMASGEMTPQEFTEFLKTTFGHLAAYSVDGALHYAFMDHHHLDEMLAAGGAVYNERKNLLVWKKTNAGMGSLYRSQHELIFVFKHGIAPHTNNIQLGVNGRYRTNVLEYPGANTFRAGRDAELARHPTPKPVALIADLIRDASNINDWVLDAFVGGGTSFIAAEKTRRRAAGIEIDPIYCDLSVERWEAFTGQAAVLAETGETFAQVAKRRLGEGVVAASITGEAHHD